MIVLAVVVASGLGALARYGLTGLVQRRTGGTAPWGTAVVNVLGAIGLGLLTGLHASGRLGADLAMVAGAGFLGAFTTFSTWMVESVWLGEEGGGAGLVAFVANVGLVLLAGLAGVALGTLVG